MIEEAKGIIVMEEKIKELKMQLEKIETSDLLGWIGKQFLAIGDNAKDVAKQADIFNKTNLDSPQKQYLYLAGLLMSTDYDEVNSKPLDDKIVLDIESKIKEITNTYHKNFVENIDFGNKEKLKQINIGLNAFSSYFDISNLNYPEQTIEIIEKVYIPFDDKFKVITNLSIKTLVDFYFFICRKYEESLNAFLDVILKYDGKEIEHLSENEFELIQKSITMMNKVYIKEIIEEYGEKEGDLLINMFSLKRTKREFKYYNDNNPFFEKPICIIDDETLFLTYPNGFLLDSIYNYIVKILENPSEAFHDKFVKKKGETIENLFLEKLKDIFNNDAKYHTKVCETPDNDEHDMLIEFENYLLIVEVKASKTHQPFFSPEKAYQRIIRHFNSNRGVGYAYAQASKLKKIILKENSVVLYENKNIPFRIEEINKKTILIIVFTLNQFGALMINIEPFLDDVSQKEFPWICCYSDLENIIKIFKYLKMDKKQIVNYIEWRIKNHSRVIAVDELDVLEAYLLNPYLKNNKNDFLYFPVEGTSLIDKIYYEEHGFPYEYEYEI